MQADESPSFTEILQIFKEALHKSISEDFSLIKNLCVLHLRINKKREQDKNTVKNEETSQEGKS